MSLRRQLGNTCYRQLSWPTLVLPHRRTALLIWVGGFGPLPTRPGFWMPEIQAGGPCYGQHCPSCCFQSSAEALKMLLCEVYFLKSLPVYRGSFHVSALGELVCVIQSLGFPSILIICLHFPSSFRRCSLACCVQQLECGGLLDGSMAVRFESGNRSRYASTQKDIRGSLEVRWSGLVPAQEVREWHSLRCWKQRAGLSAHNLPGVKTAENGRDPAVPCLWQCTLLHCLCMCVPVLRSVTISFSFQCYWY